MSKKNSRVLDDLLNKGSITPILINKNNTLEIAYEKAEGVCAAHRNGDPPSKWFYEFQCKPKDKKDLDKIYMNLAESPLHSWGGMNALLHDIKIISI